MVQALYFIVDLRLQTYILFFLAAVVKTVLFPLTVFFSAHAADQTDGEVELVFPLRPS